MQRLGQFDNKVIIEQHNEPENKNVIWKDPDENKYKEYVDGSWVESDKIATPGGGGGGLDFPYEYATVNKSMTIKPEDWELDDDIYHLHMPICDANFETADISMIAHNGNDIIFDGQKGTQEGGIAAYSLYMIDDDMEVGLYFSVSLEDNKIYVNCEQSKYSYIPELDNTLVFDNVIFLNTQH